MDYQALFTFNAQQLVKKRKSLFLLKFGLVLFATQFILGCTVTANGETRTYSVADIINTVDQTLSGTKPDSENPDYQSAGSNQPLLGNRNVERLPSAQRLDWERFLLADMQLQPGFDYTEHADSYMRIFRRNIWDKYRNDEFELESKRRETISMMKQRAATFSPDSLFLIQTSFDFGNYDFDQNLFPLDSISESSFFSYDKFSSYTLPGKYKLGFTNPFMIGDLYMNELDAKTFLQKRKNRSGYVDRKVYAKLFFSDIKLEGSRNTFSANLKDVYIYSDQDHRLLLAKYSSTTE